LIKSHPMLGGLPADMKFPSWWNRQMPVQGRGPQAGSGTWFCRRRIVLAPAVSRSRLAVRILGEVTPERCEILRAADSIVVEEMKTSGCTTDLAELCVLLPGAQRRRPMGDAMQPFYEFTIASAGGVAGRHDGGLGQDYPRSARNGFSSRHINEVKGSTAFASIFPANRRPRLSAE